MKSLPLLLLAALVTFPLARAAETLPVPQFLLRAGPLQGGEAKLLIPEGAAGTVNGTVTVEPNGFVFNEEPGVIDVPFDAAMLFGSTFTVAARLEPHGIKGHGNIVGSNPPVGFALVIHAHGHYAVSAGGPGQWMKVTAQRSVRTGATQSVVATFDGSFVTLYVDGVEAAREELNASPVAGQSLQIGSPGRSPEGGERTDLALYRLEEIAIFTEVLTPEQISAIAGGQQIPAK